MIQDIKIRKFRSRQIIEGIIIPDQDAEAFFRSLPEKYRKGLKVEIYEEKKILVSLDQSSRHQVGDILMISDWNGRIVSEKLEFLKEHYEEIQE